MFWWFMVLGGVLLAWGLALMTNWRGFAEWNAKLPGFPVQRNVTYQRLSGMVPFLIGMGAIGVGVAHVR